MDSKPDHPPAIAILALAASATAWWFGTSLAPVWWLAWLAPLPLLAAAARLSARGAALLTLLAIGAGGMNMWDYLNTSLRLPPWLALVGIITPAVLMIPPVLLWRALARRGRLLAASFAFPLLATGISWLSALLSPHGTYTHVAYTQADVLPVVQLAAFAGIWGIGTLIWLPTAALATFAVLPPARRRAGVALATALLLAIPGIGVGYARLHGDDATGALRVGLVSIGGFPESHADVRGDMGRRMLAAYLAAMERLADDGAEVIVAPESALLTDSHRIDALQGFATRRGVRVPIGAEDHSAAPRKHNAALLFTPGGDSAAAYFKHHLIPGFEDRYTPGSEPLLLDGTPRLGVAICKDLDFTATGHRYGRLGAQLLLVPAWDFGVDGWMHSRMAILRSVEGGFALARSARDGALTLSDERGRLIAEASSAGRSEPVTLVATLPLRDTRTLAARLGDLPGIVALLAALLLAAPLLFTRRSAS